MEQRRLGRQGLVVSALGLGCMGMSEFYGPGSEAESVATIHRALELGVNFLDTADVYGPHTNEELVGRALADRRDRAVLATKVGLVWDDPDAAATGTSSPGVGRNGRPEYVRASIDDSLARLRTDHVDLYQLHRVDPEVPLEETWGAMAETVAAGKAKCIGLSEVTVGEIRRAQAVHPVTSVQSELSLWTRDAQAEVLPYCQQQGIAFLPFSPLGRGFLTGRFASPEDLPQQDFRRGLPRFQQEALRANLAIVDRVRDLARRAGASPAQVALAWVLAQGQHVVPIPGTKTPRYLAENAGAAGLRLSAADLAELDAVPAAVGPRY
ncbi:MAG: aldo/keto reductase [Streptosporangiaceae bacterium]